MLFRELKLRHVKLVREKKEMMASVSINSNAITVTINSTNEGSHIRGEM